MATGITLKPVTEGKGLGPTARALILLGLALLPYTLARLVLLGAFFEDFRELGPGLIFFGVVHGIRFDLATVMPLLALPLLCLHLPGPWAGSPRWTKTWGWLGFALVAGTIPLLGGDLFYYDEVRRHLVREVILLARDTAFLPEMAFVHHLGATSVILAGIVVLAWLWRKALAPPPLKTRRPWIRLLVAVGVCVLGIRGSIDRKPINPVNAYVHQSFTLGSLSLNGVFTTVHAALGGARSIHNPLARAEAYAELGLDPRAPYPVLRAAADTVPSRKNIVVMLLESWDVDYLGCYGGRSGLTPRFDELADQSRVYEEFFAGTQRTIGGVQAVMTGVPSVPGVPELGRGLEHTNTTRVGALARAHGYRTLFIQAPQRTSYHLDSVMAGLGFDEIHGKGEIPLVGDYGAQDPKWGWDHDALQFALDRMAAGPEPFLAVIITGTTHSPYADPGPRFHVAEHEPHGIGGYLNTLVYSDWAVGEFFDRARKSSWYPDSVFLIGADHVKRAGSTDLRKAFRIPFLIHGPGIAPARVSGIYSQLDVLPTLMELMGLPEAYAAVGTGLMGPSSGAAVVTQGDRLGLITDWGVVTHTIEKRLEAKATRPGIPASRLDELERRLLATHRVTTDLVWSNRWAPAGGGNNPE